MSQVASGWHYFRDGTGAEGLYDLTVDPAESRYVEAAAASRAAIVAFRRSILRLIAEAAATLDREPEYLRRYRVLLMALTPSPQGPEGAKPGPSRPATETGGS